MEVTGARARKVQKWGFSRKNAVKLVIIIVIMIIIVIN